MTKWKRRNRLVQVPSELYERMDMALESEDHVRYMMLRVIRSAYFRGYMDGYKNGHKDAEEGYDERFEVK